MRTIDFLLETLAHFIRLDSGPPPGVPAHAGGDFETELITLCQAQHLAPIVLDSLDKLSLGPRLSHIAVERLRGMARANARRSRQRSVLADRLGEAFSAEGIPCMFMGDVVSASTLYPSSGMRHIRRIELLVRESDWLRLESVLNRQGFCRPAGAPPLENPEDVLSYYQFFSPCVFRNSSGDAVKLRFRLIDIGPPEHEIPVWNRGGARIPDGETIGVLSQEDRIIGAVVEWIRSGFTDLLALMDIGLLITKGRNAVDWNYIARTLDEQGFYSSFYLALDHAARRLRIGFAHALPVAPGAVKSKVFRIAWRLDTVDHRRSGERCNPLKFYFLECSRFSRTVALMKQLAAPQKHWISAFFGRPYSFRLRVRYVALAVSGRLYSKAA
ncbi:MAG: nucleotidyltransferase family protein [Chitinivibrionia bacterium]|nr:nucleotidyltransferase family protein [Chitinivibrionia bacterium]